MVGLGAAVTAGETVADKLPSPLSFALLPDGDAEGDTEAEGIAEAEGAAETDGDADGAAVGAGEPAAVFEDDEAD